MNDKKDKINPDINENIEDNYPKMSPLCQTLTRDGKTVEVFIYYAEDKKGWILEVEDAEKNTCVFSEFFKTDQEALKEALNTIEKEGIDFVKEGL